MSNLEQSTWSGRRTNKLVSGTRVLSLKPIMFSNTAYLPESPWACSFVAGEVKSKSLERGLAMVWWRHSFF